MKSTRPNWGITVGFEGLGRRREMRRSGKERTLEGLDHRDVCDGLTPVF